MRAMKNRLHLESSLYLQQHADNPVQWQPWDEEALSLARSENKPILLSIGYSSCHWCHVMAEESFADDATAQVMNAYFINIKVDREERPDLDKVYQTALQLINPQGGGWPLTMFLDPVTLLPFFGGTYFPREPRYQLPGFSDLLLRLKEFYADNKEELNEQQEKLGSTLKQMVAPVLEPSMEDSELLQQAREQLGTQYDSQHGGFGNAPKFAMPNALDRLLRHWAHTRRAGGTDKDGLEMFMISLTQLARGGIYDHLGGGFFRYSTDRQWMIPHFEKMLYDNAQLLSLYSHALAFGDDQLFEDVIVDTVEWLRRDMADPKGGFYSAIDADSEGEEGRYYVWRREQVRRELDEDEYLLAETLYGLDKPANFEARWNLHRRDSWRSVVDRLSLDAQAAREQLHTVKGKLLEARLTREAPATDRKVITAWNGLLLSGLVDAAVQLKRSEWLDDAAGIADFAFNELWSDGKLYATWSEGTPKFAGYLDDYANLLLGLTDLLSARWNDTHYQFALALADALVTHFHDTEQGGFYFTAHGHEQLIHRPKPTMDDALPPGNGTAVQALMALGHLSGNTAFLDAAHNTLRWARGVMEKVPAAHCTLMHALEDTVHEPQQVILRGPAELCEEWRRAITGGYQPWQKIYCIPYDEVTTLPAYLPTLVGAEQRKSVRAYVCSGLQCSLPIDSLEALKAEL